MRRGITYHPLLFAIFPILSLYAANSALFPLSDLYRPLAIVISAAAILWLVLFAIVRDWSRSALAVSVAFLVFFSFGSAWAFGKQSDALWDYVNPKSKFQTEWLVLTAVLAVIPLWKWRFAKQVSSVFNWIGVALVVLPALTIFNSWWAGHRASVTAEAKTVSRSNSIPFGKPDIFYVILDGYGRSDSLRRFLGFNNDTFVDALRKRGFYIADHSNSNYCQTELSIASSLNMGYLPDVLDAETLKNQDRHTLNLALDRNEVARYLREKGYEYVAITSGAPNIPIHSADLHVQDEAKVSLFEQTLMENTALGAPKEKMSTYLYDNRREHLISSLNLLSEAGEQTAKPRFIFAHILAPHPPFVVGANGEPITPDHPFSFEDGDAFYDNGGTPAEYRQGYVNQLQYLNKRVLAAVDSILKQERTPPIIIIQGDHGSKVGWAPESLAKTNVREVYRNLNAYYVPEPIRNQLYPDITPVNSFRILLDSLFGDSMSKLPDRSFFSPTSRPYDFTPVAKAQIEAN